jgi:hypothetical protein
VSLDQFLNSLNMKPYTSLLGVLCSLGYHIERILKNWSEEEKERERERERERETENQTLLFKVSNF